MKTPPLLPLALAAVAFGGCGSLDSNTDRLPTLATIKGKVQDTGAVAFKGAVRVAVVWRTSTPGHLQVAQDLPVQPIFPASFTIQLDGPPPPEAMQSPGSVTGPSTTSAEAGTASGNSGGTVSMQSLRALDVSGPSGPFEYAFGTVVAYADTNGNGALDLLANDAGTYIDQIVATNVGLSIVYFQGPIPGEFTLDAGPGPAHGYNVLSDTPCPIGWRPAGVISAFPANPACTQDAGPPTCNPDPRWLPVSTPFVLDVASEPEVSSLICQNGGPDTLPSGASGSGGAPMDPSIQPAHYPDPCDPDLVCAQDGSDYTYLTCTQHYNGICLPPDTTCTSVAYSMPTPVPAAWPCSH